MPFQKEHCGGQKIPKVMRGNIYRKATEWFERRVEGKTGGPHWEGLQSLKEQTGTGVLTVNEEYTYMCTYTYLLKRQMFIIAGIQKKEPKSINPRKVYRWQKSIFIE